MRGDQEPSGLDIFNLRNTGTAVNDRQDELDEITSGIARDFNTSLRIAFRMGDFSDIGRVLLASITGALSDRLADQLTAIFESFLSKFVFRNGFRRWFLCYTVRLSRRR